MCGGLGEVLCVMGWLCDDVECGCKLCDGLYVVLVGLLNVGKSLLFNVLVGSECVIVIDIVGIICDILCEIICIDGLELILVDIVGLCDGGDVIECEGMCCVCVEM